MRNSFFSTLAKLIVVLAFSPVAYAQSGNFPIGAPQLRFQLVPFGDTGTPQSCTHRIASAAAQDWLVQCNDIQNARTRLFRVHLWVTRYSRASSAPALRESYEILYWITDLTQRRTLPATGTTTWFHFVDAAQAHSLLMGQSIDNDIAGLYVTVQLTTGRPQRP